MPHLLEYPHGITIFRDKTSQIAYRIAHGHLILIAASPSSRLATIRRMRERRRRSNFHHQRLVDTPVYSSSSCFFRASSSSSSRSSASTTSTSSGKVSIAAIPVNWLSSVWGLIRTLVIINSGKTLTLTWFMHARKNHDFATFLLYSFHEVDILLSSDGVTCPAVYSFIFRMPM